MSPESDKCTDEWGVPRNKRGISDPIKLEHALQYGIVEGGRHTLIKAEYLFIWQKEPSR